MHDLAGVSQEQTFNATEEEMLSELLKLAYLSSDDNLGSTSEIEHRAIHEPANIQEQRDFCWDYRKENVKNDWAKRHHPLIGWDHPVDSLSEFHPHLLDILDPKPLVGINALVSNCSPATYVHEILVSEPLVMLVKKGHEY
ncbi:hypothetical protein GX48_06297 [Paracoccidioides brasiliensis]|nr:hypothetical protein GX48_06297 [Paracoccidioides brasiliensis]